MFGVQWFCCAPLSKCTLRANLGTLSVLVDRIDSGFCLIQTSGLSFIFLKTSYFHSSLWHFLVPETVLTRKELKIKNRMMPMIRHLVVKCVLSDCGKVPHYA